MGKSFFEKLKKGMDIKDLPKNEEDVEENLPPALEENQLNEVKQQEVKEPSK